MADAISERLRTRVWREIWDNDRISRYYGELLKSHLFWNHLFRGAIIALALVIVFVPFPENTFALKAISGVLFVGLYGAESLMKLFKVSTLTQIRKGCLAVESMLEELWTEIESRAIDEASVRFKLSQIMKIQDALVNSYSVSSNLKENRKLNVKCAKEAEITMINFYEGAESA